jgi:RHS repeat-associated protein
MHSRIEPFRRIKPRSAWLRAHMVALAVALLGFALPLVAVRAGIAAASSNAATPGDIATIAGSGTAGSSGNGGAAPLAQLAGPSSSVVDAAGDVYIADTTNNRVQETAATSGTQWGIAMTAGDIYTIAGSSSGAAGALGDGGAASSGLLDGPTGLALDSAGDLYIADAGNARIQEISSTAHSQWSQAMSPNDVYTVAGSASGATGHSGDGGAATLALLDDPVGVAIDSSNDLYIADTANNRIQEVAAYGGTHWAQSMASGDIYTIAGSASGSSGSSGDGGTAASGLLSGPRSVATDPSGDLYIADTANNRVQEIAAASGTQWGQSMSTGDTYTIVGSSSGTSGSTGDGGGAAGALLGGPSQVVVDPSGDLYIADTANNRLQEVVSVTGMQWGEAVTAGDIYTVAGSSSGASGYAGDGGRAADALFNGLTGVTVDATDDVFVTDTGNERVREITPAQSESQAGAKGSIVTVLGSASSGTGGDGGQATDAQLHAPWGTATDALGDIYVADELNNRVQEIAATTHTQWGFTLVAGDVYTIAGSGAGSSGSSGDGGAATSGLLHNPIGVALDSSGDLFIADSANDRIQFVAAASCSSGCSFSLASTTIGDVYTIAGSSTGSSGTSGDGGAATSALLHLPYGVALDAKGNLYIADTANNRIQEVAASTGTQWGQSMTADDIYTVAGSSTGAGGASGDGGGATYARFNEPVGLSLDAAGDLYIADGGNNRVQEVAAATGTQWGQSMTADDMYTIAGSSASHGASGDGGAASAAKLYMPYSVAIDTAGDLYIADGGNNRVQEIAAATGTQWGQSMTANDIYTVAGSSSGTSGSSGDGGSASSALLHTTAGIAIAPSGALYVSDQANNQLREILVSANPPYQLVPDDIETVAGNAAYGSSGNAGQATQSELKAPNGVAVDDNGNVYIADQDNNRIQEIAGTTHTQWGIAMLAGNAYTILGSATGVSGTTGDSGVGTSALLAGPTELLLDPGGDLLVADTTNNRVQELAATSHTQWGQSMTAGDVYTIAGSTSGTSGSSGDGGPSSSALLYAPQALAFDNVGDLLVADSGNNRVQFVARFACTSSCAWGLSSTTGNDIYTVAGSASGSSGYSGDGGAATSALLDDPQGMTVDPAGNLYIADSVNNRVQLVAASACAASCGWGLSSTTADDIYTIAGSASGTSGSSGDGSVASSALLNIPDDVAMDPTGNLYVADTGNHRVQEIAAGNGSQWGVAMSLGDVYTIAGNGTSGYSGDGGVAASAELGFPTSVVLDAAGDLYLADAADNVVRKILDPGYLAQPSGPNLANETTGGSNPSEAFGTPPSTADGNVAGTGASVSSSTGELDVNVEDDSIPGRGVPLALDRTYSSANAGRLVSPFGYGWTDSYNMAISSDPTDGSSVEDVYQEGGSVLRFTANGNGAWVAPSRVQAALVHNGDGTWTFTRAATTVYSFNSSGQLTSIADLNGDTTTLSYTTYETAPVLGTVTDPSGRTFTFTYEAVNGFAYVESVTDETRTVSYTYDAAGGLATVTDVGGGVTTYTYDGEHRLVAIEDPLSRTSKFAYNNANQVTSEADPMSRSTSWVYAEDTSGNGTTTTTDPLGNVTIQSFEGGELTSETDAAGTTDAATTTYGYYANTAGAKTVTDPDGHVSVDVYDQNGNLLRKTNPLDQSWTYAFNPLNEQVAATTPLGGTTVSTYDAKGDLLSTLAPEPDGSVATTSDAYTDASNPGLVTAKTDANGKTTSYAYDSHGDLASVTDPLGNETSYSYNPIGEKTSMVAARGNVSGCGCSSAFTTSYTYDGYGSLTETTDPLGHSTYATYDAVGDKLTSTDPNGNVTTNTYNADKEHTSTYLQGGSCTGTVSLCTSYTYDANGNKVTMTDANGQTTHYAYDHLNRLTLTTDPLSHTMSTSYDAAGNELTTTDQKSDVTHYTYDAANELVAEAEPGGSCTGTVSLCLTYTYDADGNKMSYTDATGNETTYAYNFLDQLTATTDPMGNVTSTTYDPAGNISTETNPDHKTTTWTYNGDNQATNVAYSDGTTHSIGYTYTPDSHVATMSDASGTSTYTYDDADRLTLYENGASATLGYGYDAAGNVTSLTYPDSHAVTNHYNALEQLASVTDWNAKQTQFTYDQDGNLSATTYPNGVTSTTAYDNADRLASITDTVSGSSIMSFTYSRDNAGLVTSETDTGTPAAGSVTDGYNALRQLTSSGSSTYSFDAANNLTSSPSGATLSYNANDEPCWSGSTSSSCSSPPTGATTYTYSSEANRTATTPSSGTTHTYHYNQANEMTSVAPSTGPATSYIYDGTGLLQSETTGTTTAAYTWDPQSSLPLLLTDGTNDYLYGPGSTPIEQIATSGGATSYLLADEIGSVRGITNSSGSITGSASYDPWGNVTGTSGSATTPFGFAGGYSDAASGFDYFRARWYDAGTGQFTSLDPKVATTLSAYSYVGNDPLNGTDPTGMYVSCGGGRTGSACDTTSTAKKTTTKKTTTKKTTKSTTTSSSSSSGSSSYSNNDASSTQTNSSCVSSGTPASVTQPPMPPPSLRQAGPSGTSWLATAWNYTVASVEGAPSTAASWVNSAESFIGTASGAYACVKNGVETAAVGAAIGTDVLLAPGAAIGGSFGFLFGCYVGYKNDESAPPDIFPGSGG